MQDYLDVFARFKSKENIEAVERLLTAHTEFTSFEKSQLGQSDPNYDISHFTTPCFTFFIRLEKKSPVYSIDTNPAFPNQVPYAARLPMKLKRSFLLSSPKSAILTYKSFLMR